jgi:ribosome-binding protein aMBF1 (putative translation factor)
MDYEEKSYEEKRMGFEKGMNPELEEDGEEHLREMLRTDEEFRALWEANRAKREFGYAVLRHRLDLGLSQRELAERVRTSQNRIYLIENGEANPTLDSLTRLAAVLGLTLEVRLSEKKPEDEVVA